jgi:RNA polymerase sigma factor (sigma-70 family)
VAARISSTLLRTQTDRRLAALAAQGSEPAFEALVERYRRPLHAYARRMLLPAEAAEDVVQQAFLSTWQALRRGTEVQDARAWLYRVTHNAAVNALKRSGYDHDQLDDALHGAEAPEEDIERRIAIRRTLAGLAALPELQREALLRTAVEGHSHDEVARALGLTGGAVRGLVYRARTSLREAATALTPAPVAQWASAAGAAPNAPLAERVAEIVAGTGTAGAGALLVKGGATLLTAGALAGGAVVVDKERGEARPERARSEQQAPRGPGSAVAELAAEDGEARRGARRARPGRRGHPVLAKARREDRRGRGRSDDDGRPRRDSSGRGSGDGSRSGSSGGGDDTRSGSSGPGSGAGDGLDDNSGSGSTSSGSGSSGDGGFDDDSGSGSTSSGSGSGSDDGVDSSGSSGSGSGDGLRSGSSGSGSSGSDDLLDED